MVPTADYRMAASCGVLYSTRNYSGLIEIMLFHSLLTLSCETSIFVFQNVPLLYFISYDFSSV